MSDYPYRRMGRFNGDNPKVSLKGCALNPLLTLAAIAVIMGICYVFGIE